MSTRRALNPFLARPEGEAIHQPTARGRAPIAPGVHTTRDFDVAIWYAVRASNLATAREWQYVSEPAQEGFEFDTGIVVGLDMEGLRPGLDVDVKLQMEATSDFIQSTSDFDDYLSATEWFESEERETVQMALLRGLANERAILGQPLLIEDPETYDYLARHLPAANKALNAAMRWWDVDVDPELLDIFAASSQFRYPLDVSDDRVCEIWALTVPLWPAFYDDAGGDYGDLLEDEGWILAEFGDDIAPRRLKPVKLWSRPGAVGRLEYHGTSLKNAQNAIPDVMWEVDSELPAYPDVPDIEYGDDDE